MSKSTHAMPKMPSPIGLLACLAALSLSGVGGAQEDGLDPTYPTPELYDYNADLRVDLDDFFLFADRFGTAEGDAGWDARYDHDGSGSVDFDDFVMFTDHYGMVIEPM